MQRLRLKYGWLIATAIAALSASLAAAPTDSPKEAVERRVLVVTHNDRPDDYASFVDSLKRSGYRVTRTNPAKFPESVDGLKDYDAVVLAELPKRQFKDKQIEALVVHTVEHGAGLLLLGGAEGLGEGGWAGSKLEEVSPLQFSRRKACLLLPPNQPAPKRPLIYEAQSVPIEKTAYKAWAELGEFPKLTGFQYTARRDSPLIDVMLQCDVVGPDDCTLLARWRYGKGHVVVFTSGDRWMADWPKWKHYDRFVKETMKLCWE